MAKLHFDFDSTKFLFFQLSLLLVAVSVAFWLKAWTLSSKETNLLTDGAIGRAAIVLPLVEHQREKFMEFLRSWQSPLISPPCDLKQSRFHLMDLILYHNRPAISQGLQNMVSLQLSPLVGKCIQNIRFIGANLTAEQDKYPAGPSYMFFNLFSPSMNELAESYDFFFWMEHDCYPCRKHWMNSIMAEMQLDRQAWMRGSILRDISNEDYKNYTFREHLNGNAWYRIAAPEFRDFIWNTVRPEWLRNTDMYISSWDIAIDLIRQNRSLVNWETYVETRHRFVHTGSIQNWYRGTANKTQLCSKYSETFLVHGSHVVE